jgi:uncharacterized protein YbjQ (UPF0145 family)
MTRHVPGPYRVSPCKNHTMGFEYEEIDQAKFSSIPSELMELAESTFSSVRLAVARNAHSSIEILSMLVEDRDVSVRETAQARIDGESESRDLSGLVDDYELRFDEELSMYMSTLQADPSVTVVKSLGLVIGTSSRFAWGFNRQAARLQDALLWALLEVQANARQLGADAVIGLHVALNNSQGSVVNAGSSEGVVVTGTAIKGTIGK